MDSEHNSSRNGAASRIAKCLDPSFLCLPPTVSFPFPVIAHNDFGLAAVVLHEDVLLYDKRTNKWYGPEATLDTRDLAANTAIDLATVARAPLDRVTAIVWLPNGLHDGDNTMDEIVASPDPEVLAAAAQDLMVKRLSGSAEPTAPWLGAYVSAALGPKHRPHPQLLRLIAAIKFSVEKTIGDRPVVAYGHEIGVAELMDPSFLLPALAVSASEDWRLATRKRNQGTGFQVHLKKDPTALLGYRLSDIQPAIPFTVLAPLIALVMRCHEGEEGSGEFYFDDIVGQFGRWLSKNGFDATVLDDIETRIVTSG